MMNTPEELFWSSRLSEINARITELIHAVDDINLVLKPALEIAEYWRKEAAGCKEANSGWIYDLEKAEGRENILFEALENIKQGGSCEQDRKTAASYIDQWAEIRKRYT
jgi:hypothetical protein